MYYNLIKVVTRMIFDIVLINKLTDISYCLTFTAGSRQFSLPENINDDTYK